MSVISSSWAPGYSGSGSSAADRQWRVIDECRGTRMIVWPSDLDRATPDLCRLGQEVDTTMTTAIHASADAPESLAGEEAGTAPGDRSFRPDVEGLRAVAVLLVVLFHASFPLLSGGFVGVDVFFVISGFVITGLLLRERSSTGHTSLIDFYARRVRRILPAATLVVVSTTIASYVVLGVVYGDPTAIAARWTAVFLANFHFAAIGTNYLTSTQPPSPLQNFWSLAVEEQFYLVYPALFLLTASLRLRASLRSRLVILTLVIIVASFLMSATQTSADPVTAFFSPFTRAWELALGALVAVATPVLLRLHPKLAATMTWTGFVSILICAFAYTTATVYPGILVFIPVVGTALVIAGGTCQPAGGVELLLLGRPVQWVGRLSYSLYLWHWPVLILAAEAAGQTQLPFLHNLGWLALSLTAAMISARIVEDPVRRSKALLRRRSLTLGIGAALIVVSLGLATVGLVVAGPGSAAGTKATKPFLPFDEAQLAQAVRTAPSIKSVPPDLMPSLANVTNDWGGPPLPCWPALTQTSIPSCMYGDPHGSLTVALYGDSHAAMWFSAMNFIALAQHWRLLYLGKGDCPVADLPFNNPVGVGKPGGVYTQCQRWKTFAMKRIHEVHPDVVILTQFPEYAPGGRNYSPERWRAGLVATIRKLPVLPSRVIVLGNIPMHVGGGPQCLSLHSNDVRVCSGPPLRNITQRNDAERAASTQTGARYIDTVPWFCSTVCTGIVGHYQPYWDSGHVTGTYSSALVFVLAAALDLPSFARLPSTATLVPPPVG
jgi:peptidoglycan/LPS O-acetylase OafA/YrhL